MVDWNLRVGEVREGETGEEVGLGGKMDGECERRKEREREREREREVGGSVCVYTLPGGA